MNVTREVITDLLPVYFAKECSQDTKLLVEEFFKTNPEFERQAREVSSPFPSSIPQGMGKEEAIKLLGKVRRLLRVRSYIMGFAILCSLAPFSFTCTQGKFYWLYAGSPNTAIIYGFVAIALWVSYFVIKRKTSDL
jgi:hypothetical protein